MTNPLRNPHALVFAILLLTAAGPSLAIPVTRIGEYDCGRWFNPKYRELAKAWLMGYLSGLSVMNSMSDTQANDVLDALQSADQAFLWMDNFCNANPLETVPWGGEKLFFELRAKAAAKAR
jgi:hypothetical protein